MQQHKQCFLLAGEREGRPCGAAAQKRKQTSGKSFRIGRIVLTEVCHLAFDTSCVIFCRNRHSYFGYQDGKVRCLHIFFTKKIHSKFHLAVILYTPHIGYY